MATVRETERRLAVITNWGFVGSFGLCLIMSGFNDSQLALGLVGFAVLIAGFVSHLIIGNLFGAIFNGGEVIVGFILFGIGLLAFTATWILDPRFDSADVTIGLAGFAGIIACFIVYVVTRFGLKGSFSMFHQLRNH
jgi:hypothetical protein